MNALNFRFFRLSFLSFVCCVCVRSNVALSQTPNQQDSIQILNLEHTWLVAEFRSDTGTIAGMLDDSFAAVDGLSVANKQEELKSLYDNIHEREAKGHSVDSFYLTDIRIQFYEESAVVTFLVVTRGRINDKPFRDRKTRLYDVWVRRNGTWKAVASQSTRVDEGH